LFRQKNSKNTVLIRINGALQARKQALCFYYTLSLVIQYEIQRRCYAKNALTEQ